MLKAARVRLPAGADWRSPSKMSSWSSGAEDSGSVAGRTRDSQLEMVLDFLAPHRRRGGADSGNATATLVTAPDLADTVGEGTDAAAGVAVAATTDAGLEVAVEAGS